MNTNETLKLTPEQEALAQALHQNSRRANGKFTLSLSSAHKLIELCAYPLHQKLLKAPVDSTAAYSFHKSHDSVQALVDPLDLGKVPHNVKQRTIEHHESSLPQGDHE